MSVTENNLSSETIIAVLIEIVFMIHQNRFEWLSNYNIGQGT